MPNLNELADSVFKSVERYLAKTLGPIRAAVQEIERKLADLPSPERGEKGDPGQDGAAGRDGTDGKDGEAGMKGDQGEPGPAGHQGEKGEKGAPGTNGKDADPELVKSLVADAVKAIPAPQNGKDADPEFIRSEVAKAMAALPAAKDGESVPIEQVQRMIDEAVAKAVGAVQMPKDGAPGRDAAHIEILPAIDAEKSYPRGTYAKHSGGLFRSFETTVGMKGWECIVDGIDSIDVDQVGDRGCVVKVRLASGTEKSVEFSIPMLIDKGVYRPEAVYAKGDGVTWGGSFFIAQKDAPACKPGEGDDWRLAVKRGRDGKDGAPPAPAVREPVRLQ